MGDPIEILNRNSGKGRKGPRSNSPGDSLLVVIELLCEVGPFGTDVGDLEGHAFAEVLFDGEIVALQTCRRCIRVVSVRREDP